MGLQRNGGARAGRTRTGTSQVLENTGAEDVSAPGRQPLLGRWGVWETRRGVRKSSRAQKSSEPRKTKPGALSPGRQPPSSSGPDQKMGDRFKTTRLTDPPRHLQQVQQIQQTYKDLPPNHGLQKKKTNKNQQLLTPSNQLQPTRERTTDLPAQPRCQSNRDRSQRSSELCSNLLKEPQTVPFIWVRGFPGLSVPEPGRPPKAGSENGFMSFQSGRLTASGHRRSRRPCSRS